MQWSAKYFLLFQKYKIHAQNYSNVPETGEFSGILTDSEPLPSMLLPCQAWALSVFPSYFLLLFVFYENRWVGRPYGCIYNKQINKFSSVTQKEIDSWTLFSALHLFHSIDSLFSGTCRENAQRRIGNDAAGCGNEQ